MGGFGYLGDDHVGLEMFPDGSFNGPAAQGRYAEAEPHFKRSLAIFEMALGAAHPNVATNLENYSALLRETGRGSEAVKLEARARAIRAKRAKENPPN